MLWSTGGLPKLQFDGAAGAGAKAISLGVWARARGPLCGYTCALLLLNLIGSGRSLVDAAWLALVIEEQCSLMHAVVGGQLCAAAWQPSDISSAGSSLCALRSICIVEELLPHFKD